MSGPESCTPSRRAAARRCAATSGGRPRRRSAPSPRWRSFSARSAAPWSRGSMAMSTPATARRSVLLMGTTFVALSYGPSRALFALGRADIDLAVNVVTLLVFLTVGLWLAWSLGPLGAALGLLVK